MSNLADLRPALAAGAMLAMLAVAYEAAWYLPGAAATQPIAKAVAATAADSVTAVAATPPAPPPAPEPCPPARQAFASSPASRRFWHMRRYVGTVGGQAATAVLEWQNPDSLTGSFYLHRGGPAYEFYESSVRPGRGVVLAVAPAYPPAYVFAGRWHLAGRPGTVLTGTWRPAHGRPLRLLLRESYAGALRYTYQQLILLASTRVPGACDEVPQTQHWLLTLPHPRAAPPALRPRLAGTPAALRRRLQADAATHDGDATSTYWDEVRLNSFQLFSYQTSYRTRAYGGTPDEGTSSWLFDLRTGRELTIESQLNPDYETPLRFLLSRTLLHDPAFDDANKDADERFGSWDWRDVRGRPDPLVGLPDANEALTLTAAGLEATYHWSLHDTGSSPHKVVLLPYRRLRPLVRPGTPLARMLAARGLW